MIRLPVSGALKLSDHPYVRDASQDLYEYLRRPRNERAVRRAPIDEGLFYEGFVNEAVQSRCLHKCVFCEQTLASDGLIDHFRPLRDARDLFGEPERDSYVWLAYEFDNLIFVCRKCAFSKGQFFPVFGERAHYMASLEEVRRLERPMFVDPYRDRIEQHFEFLSDGWCNPLTARGRVTLALIDLNREELVRKRAHDMDVFFEELEQIIVPGISAYEARSLFSPERPFAGARLNVLRRLLVGLTFGGRPIKVPATKLAESFDGMLRSDITQAERRRLRQRLEDLPGDDRDRRRWDGDVGLANEHIPAPPDSPWTGVQRNGGINNIRIENFKVIRSLELNIRQKEKSKAAPCLMLLGENAVGKSSILQAVALALLGRSQAKKLRINPADILHNGSFGYWPERVVDSTSVELGFEMHPEVGYRLDAEEFKVAGHEGVSAVVLGYGPRRYFDPKITDRPHGAYARVKTLFQVTAALPDPGPWLRQLESQKFAEVAQVIRIVLAMNDDDELIRDPENRIFVRVNGMIAPLEWLSEGYKSIFVMIADILRELLSKYARLEEAEAVVLIDEIETHLHPRWKMRVMTALRRALPRVQFIVTTHDPLCLRGMDDGEVIVLQRTPDGFISKLEGLPSTKGMRADQLLTSDYFGLSSTVDPQSELDLAKSVAHLIDISDGVGGTMGRLIKGLTLGDSAQEQIIHEAMRRFIAERERPVKRLRSDISTDAVEAVLAALKDKKF